MQTSTTSTTVLSDLDGSQDHPPTLELASSPFPDDIIQFTIGFNTEISNMVYLLNDFGATLFKNV